MPGETSGDARPARTVPGRRAGEDHARSQCPEKHPGTQGPLRGERAAEGWTLGRAWTRSWKSEKRREEEREREGETRAAGLGFRV